MIILILLVKNAIAKDNLNCKTEQYSCGENCCWSVENKALKITGGADGTIGTMDDYGVPLPEQFTDRPWKGLNITSVEIDGVSNVGQMAFFDIGTIKNISISDTVENIGSWAFTNANLGSVDIPDSVKSIGSYAFASAHLTEINLSDSLEYTGTGAFQQNSLNTVILPDTLATIGVDSFTMQGRNYPQVICQGNVNSCTYLERKLNKYSINDAIEGRIIHPLLLSGYADENECNSLNYYWNGAECVREPDKSKRKCLNTYKNLDGYCYRVRYTLPEADMATSDDNENMIEWIFE